MLLCRYNLQRHVVRLLYGLIVDKSPEEFLLFINSLAMTNFKHEHK